jgi:hypothetical protein
MDEDFAVSQEQVKRAAERALVIERYILRRAWGLCYAILGVEIALTLFLPFIFRALGIALGNLLAIDIGINLAVSLAALALVAWILKKAYGAMLIRREISESIWTRIYRHPLRLAFVWLTYYVPIVAAFFFLRPEALAIEFGLIAMSVLPFYFVLKVSFPEQLPREGVAVLATLFVCSLGSFAASILKAHPVFYIVFWVAMIAVSLWAFAYARTQKPPNPPEDHPD